MKDRDFGHNEACAYCPIKCNPLIARRNRRTSDNMKNRMGIRHSERNKIFI